MKYKAIIFDLDNTLVSHHECERQTLVYIFNELRLEYKDEYQNSFREIESKLWADKAKGLATLDDVVMGRWSIWADKIGIKIDPIEADRLFKIGLANSRALIDGVTEVVTGLHEQGYILCVATNGLKSLQAPRIADTEIGHLFTHIIASEEVGASKPEPQIFNEMLKRLNMISSEVIMVGDSLKNDIAGANGVGIASVWLNPDGVTNTKGIIPTFEIKNLNELFEIV